MWRDVHPKKRQLFFLTISLSIGLLIIVICLFVWYSLTRPPVPPQATCGSVTFLQGREQSPVSKDAQQVESCFFHAYQHCTAMSMTVTDMGVDAGTSTTYWPHQQDGTCQIITQSSSHNLVMGNSSPETTTCQKMLPQKGGLLFQHCDNSGDTFIAG